MHLTLAILLSLTAILGPPPQATSPPAEPLSRDAEIREALAAGPPEIHDGAGVYVLTGEGFELVRESSNGFHCLVERSQPGAFEPQCLDAVAAAGNLPRILLRARLRSEGLDETDVARRLGVAMANGEIRVPADRGVNYMLSPRNRVPISADTVIPFGPHVMFSAPYATNADLGFVPGPGSPVFVVEEGKPGAYIIVVVPDGE